MQLSEKKKERLILWISFLAGLLFAVTEFGFAIYSHSQSALTDAVYDSSELVFIGLTLFLIPLFHKPISEKYPYSFYQVETIFLLIKGVMMLSVTFGISTEVIESALAGGNPVNSSQVSLFQLVLGIASVVIFILIKKLNHNLSSPTVDMEILGWKLDIGYSLGLSIAFFASTFLEQTPLAWIAPYFDQIMAVAVMVLILPETIQALWGAVKEIFLFSPDAETVQTIKAICTEILEKQRYAPVFFDITKTGRHLWVSVYFEISEDALSISQLEQTTQLVNERVNAQFSDATCELIVVSEKLNHVYHTTCENESHRSLPPSA